MGVGRLEKLSNSTCLVGFTFKRIVQLTNVFFFSNLNPFLVNPETMLTYYALHILKIVQCTYTLPFSNHRLNTQNILCI